MWNVLIRRKPLAQARLLVGTMKKREKELSQACPVGGNVELLLKKRTRARLLRRNAKTSQKTPVQACLSRVGVAMVRWIR